MSAMTPEDVYIHEIVESYIKPLRDEIKILNERAEMATKQITTLSNTIRNIGHFGNAGRP